MSPGTSHTGPFRNSGSGVELIHGWQQQLAGTNLLRAVPPPPLHKHAERQENDGQTGPLRRLLHTADGSTQGPWASGVGRHANGALTAGTREPRGSRGHTHPLGSALRRALGCCVPQTRTSASWGVKPVLPRAARYQKKAGGEHLPISHPTSKRTLLGCSCE